MLATFPVSARAEPPPLETADGPSGCEAFEQKNARELARWEKEQPATPYAYPREDDVLDAPWGPLYRGLGKSGLLLLATVIPHVGAQLRGDSPATMISWPWSIPLGPAFTCSRRQGSFHVSHHRAHRLLLEPGVVSSSRGVGLFVRPGYRFIVHPSDWVVGVGAGLGSTLELTGNREPTRASVSPEGVLHFGNCCESAYFTLALRYDRFFAGAVADVVSGSLGFVFF